MFNLPHHELRVIVAVILLYVLMFVIYKIADRA